MWSICIKELRQFFSSLTGYIALVVFLLLNGLFLFVFPESNLFDYGYATLDGFFERAPWILLLLIPAITMRSFADEFRGGTFEILQTRPLTPWQLIGGKYMASLVIVLLAILPTLVYVFTIKRLSTGDIDGGGIAGSYIGLFLLGAVFTAVGTWCSSLTSNAVVAFLVSAFACFLVYAAFNAIGSMEIFSKGAGYYIDLLGIDAHYKSISRGVVDSRDIVYFLSVVAFFLFLTARNLSRR
jgi:ABC-2 type transport system permease protein